MDHLRALIVAAAFAVFCGCAAAYGVFPPIPVYTYSTTAGSGYSSSSAACTALATAMAAQVSGGATTTNVTTEALSNGNVICRWDQTANNCSSGAACTSVAQGSAIREETTGCGPNALILGAQCICQAGFERTGNACVPTNCQAVLNSVNGASLSWSGRSSMTCYQGCELTAAVFGYLSSTNTSSSEGSLMRVSGVCSGQPTTGTNGGTAPAGSCPSGQCPGTVNGQAVCVACSLNTQGPGTAASAPGGAASAPPIAGAPAGATSSESTTTCAGGNCTTTIIYRFANGTEAGRREETKPETSFCSENPASPLCVQSTLAGACAAVACTGDAIQCAIARDQLARNCTLFDTPTTFSALGAAGATGDATPAGHPRAAGVSTSMDFSAVIDQTNRLTGGCPADVTLQVAGRSLVLGFSQMCSQLQMLGSIVVGFSMLAAAFIVFRS